MLTPISLLYIHTEYLFYGNTFFQYDGIPTYIGALTNLRTYSKLYVVYVLACSHLTLYPPSVEYDCSTTLYFGDLRGAIFSKLQKLTYLVLGDNSYNMNTVPTEIITLPQLQYLYLHNCDLQGNLSFMKNFTKMQEFWIDKNLGIKGSIPTEIGKLSNSLGTYFLECCYCQERV